MFFAGCVGGCTLGVLTSNDSPNTRDPAPRSVGGDAIPRISPVPIPPESVAASNCRPAPRGTIDAINSSFASGERIENAQAVRAALGANVVGGNIVGSDGTRVSSQDSWLITSGNELYALSGDARRLTSLADGRDLLADWSMYNDEVGACVGGATG